MPNARKGGAADRRQPISAAERLKCIERELALLVGEMDEILRHPAARYELFPRLSNALRVYWRAKRELIRSRAWEEQVAREEWLLDELDKVPWKDAELGNNRWLRLYDELKHELDRELRAGGGRSIRSAAS